MKKYEQQKWSFVFVFFFKLCLCVCSVSEVQCVLLGDLLVLLQKQDDKMVLKCQSKSTIAVQEGKQMLSPIIKLDSVFLREVATGQPHAVKKKKRNLVVSSIRVVSSFLIAAFYFSSCSWQIERPSMWYSPGKAVRRSTNWWLNLLERGKCRCQTEIYWGVEEARWIRMLCLCMFVAGLKWSNQPWMTWRRVEHPWGYHCLLKVEELPSVPQRMYLCVCVCLCVCCPGTCYILSTFWWFSQLESAVFEV